MLHEVNRVKYRTYNGFTIVEMLMVLAALGILASITVVRADTARSRAFVAAMQSDLRHIATAQESYFSEHQTYAASTSALSTTPSQGVTITVNASATGWTARATHPNAGGQRCALFLGNITPLSPAQEPGVIRCRAATTPSCSSP